MNQISTSEMLQLRELLQMEANVAAKAKSMQAIVKDEELITLVKSGIQAAEGRIKGLQQFIKKNDIIGPEVH